MQTLRALYGYIYIYIKYNLVKKMQQVHNENAPTHTHIHNTD